MGSLSSLSTCRGKRNLSPQSTGAEPHEGENARRNPEKACSYCRYHASLIPRSQIFGTVKKTDRPCKPGYDQAILPVNHA